MGDNYSQAYPSTDLSSKVRDLEEKIRLLKDRVILVGQTLIDERERTVKDNAEMKKMLIKTNEENARIKEILERITEQLNNVSRKEELLIIQRQLDLLRK